MVVRTVVPVKVPPFESLCEGIPHRMRITVMTVWPITFMQLSNGLMSLMITMRIFAYVGRLWSLFRAKVWTNSTLTVRTVFT